MGLDSIDDAPPAEILEEGQRSDEALSRQLDLDLRGEELKDRQQDRELRKTYAKHASTITVSWLVGMILLLLAHGIVAFKPYFSLSDQVVSVVLGTTTVTIISLLIAIPKYILPQDGKK